MATRGRPLPVLTDIERDFLAHLKAAGKSAVTIRNNAKTVRRFMQHIGNERLDRVSEAAVYAFFAGIKNAGSKTTYALHVNHFIQFALAKLPAPVVVRGAKAPLVPAVQSEKELTLRRQWAADKLAEKKDAGEDVTAKLARQVIDGFLYFQGRLNEQGSPESIDELMRLRDNCQELIQSHLALFMSLSAQGLNLHPIINERIQRP